METLRVAYADFWPEWNDENFIEPILKKHFNVVIDQQNPDVLFHSIFGGMRQTGGYNCKKIQFLGENRRPHPGSHFSISFDLPSNKNFRLPLWQVFLLKEPEVYHNRIFGDERIQWSQEEFEEFAAFIVSNPNNFFRNGAFSELNSYKPVKSYGRYMTNDNSLLEYSKDKYWRDAKDAFFLQKPHKFMFAFENTSYPGYCTEKLMDAFLVGAIPIYWGDPKIKKEWNSKAFIETMYTPDWKTQVRDLDLDNNKFKDMYYQPIFTLEQKQKHLDNLNGFEDWLLNIVKNG